MSKSELPLLSMIPYRGWMSKSLKVDQFCGIYAGLRQGDTAVVVKLALNSSGAHRARGTNWLGWRFGVRRDLRYQICSKV